MIIDVEHKKSKKKKKIDLNHLREIFPLKHIFPSSHNSLSRINSRQMLQKKVCAAVEKEEKFLNKNDDGLNNKNFIICWSGSSTLFFDVYLFFIIPFSWNEKWLN